MYDGLLNYPVSPEVEAFTAGRDARLPYPVLCPHQVHGCRVGVVDREGMTREDFEGYDALVTNLPVAIGVRTADCIPVLLFDPLHKAVAAIHSGWKGTVRKIVPLAISKMESEYRTVPESLLAVVGPGIGFDSFQVGEEVPELFREAGFPLDIIWRWDGAPLPGTMCGGHHIDLKAANRWLLEQSGVLPQNIRVEDACTYSDAGFYSARREGASCGRNINAISLLPGMPAGGSACL